ncbi:hypothetical protein [Bacillus sp. MRMR6]|uniref:hypothetical protein n=1 Tax=Bacillus sp. MRMR6 TaxID=1928617 RepID=UPI00158AD9D4|nr:hypothetical protein [Bacillus sp. MRMR6]
MKWVQINDLAYEHVFELEGDESTTIHLVGDIEKAKSKLKIIFGSSVEIETFEDEE